MTALQKCPECGGEIETFRQGEYAKGTLYVTYCDSDDFDCHWEIEEWD